MAAKKTPKTVTKTVTKAVTKTGSSMSGSDLATQTIAAISKMTAQTSKQRPLGVRNSPYEVVSSGSTVLNTLIGGNPAPDKTGPICFGYPRQHYSEIFGPEGSGKTTLALEAIAELQAEDPDATVMYLDFEHALHHGYAQAVGVRFNPPNFMLYQPDNMEEGLDMMAIGIKAGVDIIVVDSVAAMVTKAEMEKNFKDVAKIGTRAAKFSEALPKIVKFLKHPPARRPQGTALILINQTRADIGGKGTGDSTAGGKALKFYAYLRLDVRRIGSEYIEKTNPLSGKKERVPYGNKIKAKIVKSKVDAKQGHTTEFFIRYGRGIDEVYSIIECAVDHKLVKKSGSFYEYGDVRVQGRERFRSYLVKNEEVFAKLKDLVLKAILAYTVSAEEVAGGDDLSDDIELSDQLVSSINGDDDDVDDDLEDEVTIVEGEIGGDDDGDDG